MSKIIAASKMMVYFASNIFSYEHSVFGKVLTLKIDEMEVIHSLSK